MSFWLKEFIVRVYNRYMKFALMKNNLADMRSEPSYDSELVNQVLFREKLRIETVRSGFALVVQEDGYTGWVDMRYLKSTSRDESLRLNVGSKHFVCKASVPVFTETGASCWPHQLFYGTVLYGKEQADGRLEVSMPRFQLYVKSSNLVPIKDIVTTIPTRKRILAEAKKFLGIPYLWGGVTSLGFDCSGLVRAVFGRFGISLPRDTKDQIAVGMEIDRSQVKMGDLLFFDRHVGIAGGNDTILHASRGAGLICVESLDRESQSYRSDLDASYRTARRLL